MSEGYEARSSTAHDRWAARSWGVAVGGCKPTVK